jgi:hypothetical protein
MLDRAFRAVGLVIVLAALPACSSIDLSQALQVTDVLGGYYDNGVHPFDYQDGRGPVSVNQIKASLTFRLRNTSSESISSIQLLATFWKPNADGDADSVLITAVGSDGLAPGATTDQLTIRSNINYNVEGARASLFTDPRFVEMSVKLFAKRSGGLYKLGEFPLDRVILPHAGREAPR